MGGTIMTVGMGRDLSSRCASVKCARILLMLSECAGTPVALGGGSTVEGVGTTRGTGVAAGVGPVCGLEVAGGAFCGATGRGVGCGVGVRCGCCGGMTMTVRGRVDNGVGCGAGVCACAETSTSDMKLSITGNIARVFIINLSSQG
jgi:hypothetical protein